MRIRFIETAATQHQCFVMGREYDLETNEAAPHLKSKHAIDVTPKPEAEPKAEAKPLAAKKPEAKPAAAAPAAEEKK